MTAVKQVLSQSSHTLLWKVLMAEELEELAAWQKAGQRDVPADAVAADAAAPPSSDAFDSGRLSVLDKSLAMILDRMPQFQPDRVHVEVRPPFSTAASCAQYDSRCVHASLDRTRLGGT